jgi:2-methylisocitrate lyase-like PEP mutase family enzyme
MNAPVKSLSARLREPGLVVAPGVFDMVSLRLADRRGYEAAGAAAIQLEDQAATWRRWATGSRSSRSPRCWQR